MSINGYPKSIYLLHKAVRDTSIKYKLYAMDDDKIYYKLSHNEELEYEDEEVEEGDYMLSTPNDVFRYLAIYKDYKIMIDEKWPFFVDETKNKIYYELGDFSKKNIGDKCLYSKNNNL